MIIKGSDVLVVSQGNRIHHDGGNTVPRLTRAQGDSGRGSQLVCVINAAACFRHKVSISLLNASPSESDRGCARTLLTPHIFMRNGVPLLNKICVWASVAVYHLSFEPSIPALHAARLHVSKYGKPAKATVTPPLLLLSISSHPNERSRAARNRWRQPLSGQGYAISVNVAQTVFTVINCGTES